MTKKKLGAWLKIMRHPFLRKAMRAMAKSYDMEILKIYEAAIKAAGGINGK